MGTKTFQKKVLNVYWVVLKQSTMLFTQLHNHLKALLNQTLQNEISYYLKIFKLFIILNTMKRLN